MNPQAPDHYRLLEVHPEASPEVIERAYKVLARRYHPDVVSEGRRVWAHQRMAELNQAYSVLSDPQRRAAYDRARMVDSQRDVWQEFLENGLLGVYRKFLRTPTGP